MRKVISLGTYIEGEIQWELSHSKSKEKYQSLDLRLIIGCGEQSTTWSN